MKKTNGMKIFSIILSVALAVSSFSFGMPLNVKAETEKKIDSLGTNIIKAPAVPASADSPWTGSYVWYGKYNNEPVRYRVLSPYTGYIGGRTLLLDCDTILTNREFGDYAWNETSCNVRNYLNNELLNSSFTDVEKFAIRVACTTSHEYSFDPKTYLSTDMNHIGLLDVIKPETKLFLLDVDEVLNPEFGYSPSTGIRIEDKSNDERIIETVTDYRVANRNKYFFKTNKTGRWWLRTSAADIGSYVNDKAESLNTFEDGVIVSDHDNATINNVFLNGVRTKKNIATQEATKVNKLQLGVSPAFGIDAYKIIFATLVSGTAGQNGAEYKLTLQDDNIELGVQSGEDAYLEGRTLKFPYEITGSNAGNVTRISYMILNDTYSEQGETNPKILYYGKMNTEASIGTKGIATFELPAALEKKDWNDKYSVYLVAEDVNGEHETDYASNVFGVHKPDSCYQATVTFDANGGSGHMDPVTLYKLDEYILPECEFTPPAGKEFDTWLQGKPGTKITIGFDEIIIAQWKDKKDSKEDDTKKETIDKKLKTTSISKLKAGAKNVKVTWKKQTVGTKGYEIQYSTDKKFKKNVKSVIIKKTKTTSKNIKKLKPNKKYYFRIRTYKVVKKEKVYSNWSKAISVKTKKVKK